MRALRVLHTVANRWWTGSAEPALDLARALRERGHVVTFACIRGDALEARVRTTGLPLAPSTSLERTARPWVLLRDVRALRHVTRVQGIELVHAHLTHDHWLGAVALSGTGVRLVRSVHHRRAVRRGPALRWLWRRTDAAVATSTGIAAAIQEANLTGTPVTVVGGAVDARRFTPDVDPTPVRAELGLTAVGPVVGCVARLVPGRAHDVLLQAVARLRPRWPGLRLVLAGRGEGRPAIERLVGELGLGETVVFAGYRGDDLPAVLAAMDCFALLGGGSEESGRAVLEAMAAGRPVIAGRFGAMPDTVVDGETGWLAEARPDEVTDRLAAVLADPGRAREMGAAGRRRVMARFTSERRAEAVEAVYAAVVAR